MTDDAMPPKTAVSPKDARPDRATLKAEKTREDRLKAALKANMARRKAQTRARSVATEDEASDNFNADNE